MYWTLDQASVIGTAFCNSAARATSREDVERWVYDVFVQLPELDDLNEFGQAMGALGFAMCSDELIRVGII